MRSPPALALHRRLLLVPIIAATSAACSLLAPSDAELLGRRAAGGAAGQSGTDGGGLANTSAGAAGSVSSGVDSAGESGEAGASSLSEAGTNATAANAGQTNVGGVNAGGTNAGGTNVGGSSGSAASAGVAGAANIPTNSLLLWLQADRGVHLVDGAVDVWADQSGAAHDAFKNIANQRPKLAASTWNNLPILQFDGIDDDLALPEGFSDFSAGLTFFASVSQESDSECSAVLQLSNGAEADDVDFSRVDASLSYEVIEQTVEGVHGAYALNQRVLLAVVARPNETVDLRINGEFTNGAAGYLVPSTLMRSKNFVARSLYASCTPFGGKIAEILLYARALSASEVTRVEAYLKQKWGCCK